MEMEENLRQEEQEQIRKGQPKNQNSAHNTVEQREADNRLLDIVSNQLHALGAAVNRTGMFLLALCLVVVMETAALIGVTLWHSSAISRMQAEMERQHVVVMTAMQKMDSELSSVSTESKGCMERVKKYVWELKAALDLKFSQQRSGIAPQQGQDVKD